MTQHVIVNGRFKFHLSYRHLAGDEGLAIGVTGPADLVIGEQIEYTALGGAFLRMVIYAWFWFCL